MEDDESEGGDLMRMRMRVRMWLRGIRGTRSFEICNCFYGYRY